MDGLEWKNLIKMDDLGVPLFWETSRNFPSRKFNSEFSPEKLP